MPNSLGLLLAVMEPPATGEAEFHDWYDTEHVPERARLDGFLSALRFVCTDGAPRYMALYDLTGLHVLAGGAYAAISGERLSPWSRRMLSIVHSRYSVEAEQIYPRTAVTGHSGKAARLLLLRFRNTPQDEEAALLEGLKVAFAGPEVLQARLFRALGQNVTHHLAIVEANGEVPAWNARAFGAAAHRLDLMNVYAPYWRLEPRVAFVGTKAR